MASLSSFRSVIVPLLLLGALAGCDKQNNAAPQATASAVPAQGGRAPIETTVAAKAKANVDVIGTLDRSHKGESVPAVEFLDPAGKPVSLVALAGKPMLVNLWATWCGPCVTELPTLDKTASMINVVAISQDLGADGAATAAAFLKEHGATHLLPYADPETKLSTVYEASLPTSILYNSAGREVWRMTGGMDWTTETAKALLHEAR